MTNLIIDTDSYKFSHHLFYPEGTTEVFSYAESRGGVYGHSIFAGLASFAKHLQNNPITRHNIEEAKELAINHGVPFNEAGWNRILDVHSGYLPLEIRGLPEGMRTPVKNVMTTVRNTDPLVPWLTSYIETPLIRMWYPITVATRIFGMKQNMKRFFDKTADNTDMSFSLLDFSARGCSSYQSAEIGGSAYLMSFLGSDNVPAVDYVNRLYKMPMSGFSVPATEHSVMTSYGKENERASLVRILNQAPRGGIISIVCDSWDIYNAIDMLAEEELKDIVKNRKLTLVIRPDSGEIDDVLTKVLSKCLEKFPWSDNSKGYAVFDYIKVLWGDGINENTCTNPFALAQYMGISAESIMIGSGGGLMQANIDRDTMKFAFKASNVIVDGISKPIAKEPITDPGKKSKRGKLKLIQENGEYKTVTIDQPGNDLLIDYYRNGKVNPEIFNFDAIRKRVDSYLV